MFTATLVTLVARERPTRLRLGALALGLGGAIIFLLSAPVDAAVPPTASWATRSSLAPRSAGPIYTLMGRRLMSTADPFRVSTWAMTFGGLFLAVWAAPELVRIDWTALPPDFWLEIGYLALLPTALGYALYYRGVRDVGPTTASVMMFLVPISGATLACSCWARRCRAARSLGALTMAGGALLAVLSTRARRIDGGRAR